MLSKTFLIFLKLPIFLGLLVFLSSCSSEPGRKHILLIQSYEASFPSYPAMNTMLASRLKEKQIKADIFSVYLDSEQNPEKQQQRTIYATLDTLQGWKPDLILVNDDAALNALLISGHPAVDTLPVVFMGAEYPNFPQLYKKPNITGFYNKPDYRTNVKLIDYLIGKCIIVRVSDDTWFDKQILHTMDEQIGDLSSSNDIFSPARVRISGKNGLSLSGLPKIRPETMYVTTLNARSARSLIKGVGENYYNKAFLATKRDYLTSTLGRLCAFPSFTVVNEVIGYNNGVVGGYVSPMEDQVRQAADRVAGLLSGAPVSRYSQITETSKAYVFDYKALSVWDISLSKLPAGSVLMNLPFYVRYQYPIIIGLSLAAILFMLTVVHLRRQNKRETAFKMQAQKRLEEEKRFLSFALESGNIYTFRYKNGIFEFDKEFYHSLGLPEKAIDADQFYAAIHPDEQADFILNRHKLDNGFPSRQITRRRYDFNRKGYQWWEFRYAQNTTMGEITSENIGVEVSGLCLNIQQIKETEQSLTEARKKAEESDHMKSVFLANMSHEIRTPLNAIVGFSQLLSSDMPLDTEQKSEFTDLINKNSDLLLKLINDILDLSRIEAGRVSFTFENCDLSQLIDDVYHTHKLLMPANVELRCQTPPMPAFIFVDRFRLTQVLTNFINNATKFTAHGFIELKYDYNPDLTQVFISVTDTGVGIPEDKVQQVFERFQKLDEFAQGTGLGLAISQSIIKAFNGHITLESEVGKGSTFTIALPYSAQPA